MKKFSTKTLILMALFAAISIILARFMVIWITQSVRISFGNIPIILASLLLGPIAGGFTGEVADIVGASYFSPFHWYPPLTIAPILVGATCPVKAIASEENQPFAGLCHHPHHKPGHKHRADHFAVIPAVRNGILGIISGPGSYSINCNRRGRTVSIFTIQTAY